MEYRHEWKHEISRTDLIVLRRRLRAVMAPDEHAVNGCYRVRSLYFDTPEDRALREKLDGVGRREKFRLRLYNGDAGMIRLEKKIRCGSLGSKGSAAVTAEEVRALLAGDTGWMAGSGRALVEELRRKMQTQRLRPKTVVEYRREPFVYAPGNVRVTLDYDLRTGLGSTDFLDPHCLTVPAGDAPAILEVKWDAYLPDIIRAAAALPDRRAGGYMG